LRFIEERSNLLSSARRRRKTMLAVCLAARRPRPATAFYFTSARILWPGSTGRASGPLATSMRFFAGPALLIVDELGYLPLQAEGARRSSGGEPGYLKGSICLTTTGPSSAGPDLRRPMVARPMLDRMLHRSCVLQVRVRATHARPPRPRRAAARGP